jgi:hypothetical protein
MAANGGIFDLLDGLTDFGFGLLADLVGFDGFDVDLPLFLGDPCAALIDSTLSQYSEFSSISKSHGAALEHLRCNTQSEWRSIGPKTLEHTPHFAMSNTP